jgi:protein translocase SecG subunit
MNDISNIRTVFTILVFLSSLGIIVGYLFQSPKATGLGAISGNATVFKSRKPIDAFLDKVIITSAIVFGISVFILAILKQS